MLGVGRPSARPSKTSLFYLAEARGSTADHEDTGVFTGSALTWLKRPGGAQKPSLGIGSWSEAARIVLAFTLHSASAERALSLMKLLFGGQKDSALGGILQASVVIRCNKRDV